MFEESHGDETKLLLGLREGSHVAFARIYDHYWKKMLLIAWNHQVLGVLAICEAKFIDEGIVISFIRKFFLCSYLVKVYEK